MDLQTTSPVPGSPNVRIRDWALVLTAWFDENKRLLPWRKSRDPYAVWISEIMLQQTRIEAVIPYYDRFIERFPTVEALAEANEEEVLKYWEGMGYYSRARNLHRAAKEIVRLNGFPKTKEEWVRLPGIGEYTAGAIAAIAFGEETLAIDGNVMRVVSRLEALTGNVLEPSSRKQVEILLNNGYPHGHASSFVQGLMELGETICLPKEPRCGDCPLLSYCLAKKQGLEHELPIRNKEILRKEETRQVFMIRDEEGRLLMKKRPGKGVLAGLYELPNILKRSDDPSVIEKDLFEAYGLTIRPEEKLGNKKHIFTHITWYLEVWEASLAKGQEMNDAAFYKEEEVMLPTAFKKLLGMELNSKRDVSTETQR